MSAPTGDETPKVRVLLVGDSPHLFVSFQFPLERVGCECHFAKSHEEMGKLFRHTKPDVVLSLNTCQSLSEMASLLGGLCVSMFHMLPVEEGCWWLPVVRNGENCLGAPAFRPNEFAHVLAEIVRGLHTVRQVDQPHSDLDPVPNT
jgi:hypothetical protein